MLDQWFTHMRHGKGIQQDKEGTKYDGLWLKNKRHGAGVVIKLDGKVREGQWAEGELVRWTSVEMSAAKRVKAQKKNKKGGTADDDNDG